MVKRKKAKKLEAKKSTPAKRQEVGARSMPMPAFLLKALAIVLSVILLIALTLYVIGRMPARGFFTLAVILAIIAFVIMPAMRKKFVQHS